MTPTEPEGEKSFMIQKNLVEKDVNAHEGPGPGHADVGELEANPYKGSKLNIWGYLEGGLCQGF